MYDTNRFNNKGPQHLKDMLYVPEEAAAVSPAVPDGAGKNNRQTPKFNGRQRANQPKMNWRNQALSREDSGVGFN